MFEDISRLDSPAALFWIKDLPTLKVISDPFRLQILGLLLEPHTVKQLSARLDLAPVKLYYHINLLEQHGLIRVTGSRLVSGIVEKFYQVSAQQFRMDGSLFSFTPQSENQENLDVYLASILETARDQIKKSVRAGLVNLTGEGNRINSLLSARASISLTPAKAEIFYKRLADLINELDTLGTDTTEADAQLYGFSVVMYPMLPEPPESEAI